MKTLKKKIWKSRNENMKTLKEKYENFEQKIWKIRKKNMKTLKIIWKSRNENNNYENSDREI